MHIGTAAKNALKVGAAGLVGYTALQATHAFLDSDTPGMGTGDTASPPNDVTDGQPLKTRLPMQLRAGVSYVDSAIGQAVRSVRSLTGENDPPPSDDGLTDPVDRARASWKALDQHHSVAGSDGHYRSYLQEPVHVASNWAYGQILHAVMTLAMVTGDYSGVKEHVGALEHFRQGDGYAPGPGPSSNQERYFDDNAWVGLALAQGHLQTKDPELLEGAKQVSDFIQTGMHPDGGVQWVEHDPRRMRPTAANGPALELDLRLYQATGDKKYLDRAHQFEKLLNQLRRPNGLYDDNINDTGARDHALYSYNQGTPIGANVLWYRITGDESKLDAAEQTATSAIKWLKEGDNLWRQPAAFNGIFFRNLIALDAVRPNPEYRQLLSDYVERGWKEARNPETGILSEGDVGSYTSGRPGSSLDQAAWVQMQALLAVPSSKIPDLT
jgi:hypothetical protein